MTKKNFSNARIDNPLDSVDINPFGDTIGTRMEVQMSGIIADLLLKLHNVLPFANNTVLERYLIILESYFDPYMDDKEKEQVEQMDSEFIKQINQFHPKDRARNIDRIYSNYVEKKLKILMNCAYKQDMLPGRIKTMKKL